MRLTFESKAAQSRKYRPDIDGLRAIAVLIVLFYHAQLNGFDGGFVGVDIFFVISGYLIASLIQEEITLGKFSLVSFYERRIRRIFPALFATTVFCTLAAAVLFPPEDFLQFGRSLMAMAAFMSNIFFMRESGDGGYFDRASRSQVLLHTWSLSLEEQFYVLFPVALILLGGQSRGLKAGCLLSATIASLSVSVWDVADKPLGAFYWLAPRIWELLIGALLTMNPLPSLNHRCLRESAGLMGFGLVCYATLSFDKFTDFPGLNALFPCLGAALIIYACETGGSSVRTILSFRPLVSIGVISYSLYLWHWPIIVFIRYFFAGYLGAPEQTAAILSSLVAAFISFEFIESPFRGKDSPVTRRQIFGFGTAASIFFVALGFSVVWFQGFPGRYNDLTRDIVVKNMERRDDFLKIGSCANFRTEIHNITDVYFCGIGRKTSKKIMFWGDSHIEQLYPLIQKIYNHGELHNKGVVFAIAAACPPIEHMNHVGKGYHCDAFFHFAMIRARQSDIDTVFIGYAPYWALPLDDRLLCNAVEGKCKDKIGPDERIRSFLNELPVRIHALRALGKRVIIALPFPIYDRSIPELQIHNAIIGPFLGREEASEVSLPNLREQITSIAKGAGADIFDPRKSLCTTQGCLYQKDDISIYRDGSHIAASQIDILENDLVETLSTQPGPIPGY